MKGPRQRGSPRYLLLAAVLILWAGGVAMAENIDPDNDDSQYAWGENVGWCNTEPQGDGGPGMTVTDSGLSGWIWGENIGWISLSCSNTTSCGTKDYGVTNDGEGNLAGHAWAENAGWISFSCANTGTCAATEYGVSIDPFTGEFSGRAWGENIGWVTFASQGPNPYTVKTAWTCPDADGDIFCAVADCNDGDPDVNPGMAEVCGDAIDNDCNAGTPDVFNADGDGFDCTVDCDDGNPYTYPAAPEVLDHLDNQCAGDPGYGQIDEGMDVTGFVFLDKDTATWDTLAGISGYEAAFGPDPQFDGCTASNQSPPAGGAPTPGVGGIYYFLVHAYGCFPDCVGGSWGQTSSGPERVVPCATYPPIP